jgi:phosphotransferase system  glucose/maltose/N-acetylglucosamine-specific IIC component
MNASAIRAMYARSLAWLTVLAAVICGVSNIMSLVLIDFVHGNPHRTQENAIEMIVLFTPLFGLIAAAGTVIGFALPQCFQAVVSGALVRRFGGHAHVAVLLALPMTAIITWYSYDYLTPTDVNLAINTGPDWQPYQHGITAARYLAALACQTPVTLFSVAYIGTTGRRLPRKAVLLLALTAALLAGGFAGYRQAEGEYQFL